MTKNEETKPDEKGRLLGHLSYLPHRSKGYGSRIGPLFSTSREDCKSLVVESIPLALVRDIQRGEIGSFFIWDRNDEGGA